jgi:sensor histidine kinase YesM
MIQFAARANRIIMQREPVLTRKRKSSINVHLLFCVLSSIVVFAVARIYAKNVGVRDDEEFSTAAIIIVLGGIYIGRFLAQLWIPANKDVPSGILLALPIIMTGCIFTCVFFASSLSNHMQLMYVLYLAFPLFILSIATGVFVKLIREKIKKQVQDANISAAHSQSELQLLHSQLSPHFLFNTLNNMYGISIMQHEKIPPLLLKLSELLRYSVYGAKEMFVPLKDELSYIDNYIDFEKLRIGDRLNLTIDMEEIKGLNGKIAPMLLITFVENAFKHARNTIDQRIFIDIAAKSWQGNILFGVKNSYVKMTPENELLQTNYGFGLESVKKRLELLYPGAHDLQIGEEDGFYTVMLRLKIRQ